MKLLKEKRNQLQEINEEYLAQTLKGAKILHDLLNQFIEKKLNKADLEQVIQSEHKCDRLKEKYIQVLFKEKRALPFLVEDRYQILMNVDQINDKTEYLARFMQVFPFELYDDIIDEFITLCENCMQTVELLINCATLIETDFDSAYAKTFEIEEVRRKARKAKFHLLEVLYKKSKEPTRVYLTSKLVTIIYEVANWAEDVSDFLRGLIIKYPSR
jgi:predicted phosphate transport protein (TIGR00153 family)